MVVEMAENLNEEDVKKFVLTVPRKVWCSEEGGGKRTVFKKKLNVKCIQRKCENSDPTYSIFCI